MKSFFCWIIFGHDFLTLDTRQGRSDAAYPDRLEECQRCHYTRWMQWSHNGWFRFEVKRG